MPGKKAAAATGKSASRTAAQSGSSSAASKKSKAGAGRSPGTRHSLGTAGSAKVQLVSSKLAYRGPLFDVYTDYVREPEGIVSRRDVIRHTGSVVVLAVDATASKDDPQIVIERQYRHAAGRYMWEVPAGRREAKENVLRAAKRELLEETGYSARRWTKLAYFYVSPGFLGEWMQVYLAEGLTCGISKPDEDEYIEHRLIPFSQALKWVETGKIIDAKSIVAILMYAQRRAST
jgi:ADP-ribose pyrophosphatase